MQMKSQRQNFLLRFLKTLGDVQVEVKLRISGVVVNCLLRGMKGLEAHIIMRGDAQPAFKKAHRVPYALKEQVGNELDKLENMGS